MEKNRTVYLKEKEDIELKSPLATGQRLPVTKAEKEAKKATAAAKAEKSKAEKAVTEKTTKAKKETTSAKKTAEVKLKETTEKAPKTPDKVTGEYNGKKVYTGPRGGRYYINKNGNKTYIEN